jgi:hypothetical protein
MGMPSFAVAEMGADERDYDNWLTTLTQASARLDQLQKVVGELCQLRETEDVVQADRCWRCSKGTVRSPSPLMRARTPPS